MSAASAAVGFALLAAFTLGACAHEPRSRAGTPVSASLPGGACRRPVPPCEDSGPAYAADVRPVLERHCFKCHAGDGVAADEHDWSRPEVLRAQRAAVASSIGACAMPPSSEPPLPDAEAATLLSWVACANVPSATRDGRRYAQDE